MDIKVVGSNIDVNGSLADYVNEHLINQVKKYFDNALSADVHFAKQSSKNSSLIHVNILVNEGVKSGIKIKGDAEASDPYVCFNEALKKISKQLRRYKGRMKNYRRKQGGLKSVDLPDSVFDRSVKYVISAPNPLLEEMEEEFVNDKIDDSVKIIAEKTAEIENLTVEEAIMKMNLMDLPALVFFNSDKGRLNVIYNRKDGNISWIDPS